MPYNLCDIELFATDAKILLSLSHKLLINEKLINWFNN